MNILCATLKLHNELLLGNKVLHKFHVKNTSNNKFHKTSFERQNEGQVGVKHDTSTSCSFYVL